MGWYEEEKIANEVAWAKEDITYELRELRAAQQRAADNTTNRGSHHESILTSKQRRKLMIIVVSVLLGIDVLANIVIGIICLLNKFGIIN